MNNKQWKNQYKIESDFEKSLIKCKKYFDKIRKASEHDAQRFSSLMNELQQSDAWEKFVQFTVNRMVTPLAVQNEQTWRKAARKSSRGYRIYRTLLKDVNTSLQRTIQLLKEENASLIRTLPSDVAEKVVNDVQKEALKGVRAPEIAKMIRKYTDQHTMASARLIARTEVSKTQSALTQARSEMLDIQWYVWRTEEDQRVRKSHRIMNDVLVAWRNPPSPETLAGEENIGNYHAGNIWNCRCYAEPLVEINDIKFPHKVYYNGQIQTMTKVKFMEIM